MFDSVYISCPKCNYPIEFQSKAYWCDLTNYNEENCPDVIKTDLDGKIKECDHCGSNIQASLKIKPELEFIINEKK